MLKHIPGKTNTKITFFQGKNNEYQRGQQGCSTPKERILAMKDNSKNHNNKRKMIVEESNILKEIRRNITREKEVIQALKKKMV